MWCLSRRMSAGHSWRMPMNAVSSSLKWWKLPDGKFRQKKHKRTIAFSDWFSPHDSRLHKTLTQDPGYQMKNRTRFVEAVCCSDYRGMNVLLSLNGWIFIRAFWKKTFYKRGDKQTSARNDAIFHRFNFYLSGPVWKIQAGKIDFFILRHPVHSTDCFPAEFPVPFFEGTCIFRGSD